MFPVRPQRQPETLMSINFLLREMPCDSVEQKQRFVGYRDDGWGNTIRIVITTYLEFFGLDYNYHVSISKNGYSFYSHVGYTDKSVEVIADVSYVKNWNKMMGIEE